MILSEDNMNLNDLSLAELIEKCEKENLSLIINDGKIVETEVNNE